METESTNTPAFNFLAWASLGISGAGTLAGIFYLEGNLWAKGFLAMGYLFSITSCFTVAKTVRDQHEAKKITNRIKAAQDAKLLKDYDTK